MISAKKWYLGGPMTGYPEFNFPAFDDACRNLRSQLTVVSAHEVDHGEHTGTGTKPWEEYVKIDLEVLLRCDGAIFLQGWPNSKGARMEFDIAVDLGYPVYEYILHTEGTWALVPLTKPETFNE